MSSVSIWCTSDQDASSQIYSFNGDFLRQVSGDELCLDYRYDRDTSSQIYSFNSNFLRGTAGYKLCLEEASWIFGFNGHIFKGILRNEFRLDLMY